MAAVKLHRKLYRRTTWRMDLRQLTVYELFGWVNLRAITFLCGPKFTSSGCKDTPTSPEVTGTNTLNFRPNFKLSRSKCFFLGGGDLIRYSFFGCALSRLGQYVARMKI